MPRDRSVGPDHHLPNILTYFQHRISNAVAEGLNSRIQTIKANARGHRSFEGFLCT
ncbi:transposase [Thiolapillus sp.]|uniref:transposase n=2 Tax=Thiolapillus sp. TaxID=2017437 RepID=UPI003AF4A3E9